MTFERRTVRDEVILEGFGLHFGEPVKVRIIPGGAGIRFHWNGAAYAAVPENVTDSKLSTALGPIATIEHLMSAFAGAEITDADVELTAPELPALDGSALPFYNAILAAGFEVIGECTAENLFTRIFKHDEAGKIALSAGTGHWRYRFSSENRYPFESEFEVNDVVLNYFSEIAPARTFGWEVDLPAIREAGLAKGLDENSAVLLGNNGPLNFVRFADEPVRHKLLDAIGDIYLAGIPIRLLNFSGERSGHALNVQVAHHLRLAAGFDG